MKISIDGMMAILQDEAISLGSYVDSGGVLTIGAGHTARAGGLAPTPGMKLSLDECLRLFLRDVEVFDRRVAKAIKVLLVRHEHDALVRFDLNTGAVASGSIDEKLNRGDRKAAMDTLSSYVNDNGKRLAGLVRRRKSEREQFLSGTYPPATPIIVFDKYPHGKSTLSYPDVRAALVRLTGEQQNVGQKKTPGKAAAGAAAVVVGGGAAAAQQHGIDWRIIAGVVLCVAVVAVAALVSHRMTKDKVGG